jgi:FixJ family two-component response regulator
VIQLTEHHAPSGATDGGVSEHEIVCVIDDDEQVRASLDSLLRSAGYVAQTFASPEEFLQSGVDAGCLLLDVRLKNADGLAFQEELLASEALVPVVLMSGYGDIPMSVRGMKAGAVNFLTKPFDDQEIVASVREAVERGRGLQAQAQETAGLRARYDSLTPREREVMGLVTAGLMNKQVAGRLGVQEITVKIHRGNVMRKMRAQSLPDLVRMAETLDVRETSASRFARAPA